MNEQKFTDKGEEKNMMKNKTNVKWKKRADTIVMSLCLLMGLIPITVFAAGSSEQLPVYTIESEADGDYVERPGVTATFTSDTVFTLGEFIDVYGNKCGVKLDYYNPNAYPNLYDTPDEGFDILVEFMILLQFTNPTDGSISGEITIPLPSGYDGATARTKDGATAISYNETTVTFPVTLVVYSGNAFTQLYVEYKEKPQHTHSYGDWQKDETNHWHECACGEKADSATHSYDNDADTTCNVCGYVRTVTTPSGATTAVSPDAKSPKTGDNNNLFLWTTMLCISGFAIFGTRIYSKKEKNIK